MEKIGSVNTKFFYSLRKFTKDNNPNSDSEDQQTPYQPDETEITQMLLLEAEIPARLAEMMSYLRANEDIDPSSKKSPSSSSSNTDDDFLGQLWHVLFGWKNPKSKPAHPSKGSSLE